MCAVVEEPGDDNNGNEHEREGVYGLGVQPAGLRLVSAVESHYQAEKHYNAEKVSEGLQDGLRVSRKPCATPVRFPDSPPFLERQSWRKGAPRLGEILGSGCAAEAEGLLTIRSDGDGLARAMALALEDAGLDAVAVGMIVAHGNGTRQSDASEAAAILRVFGDTPPPITAFESGKMIGLSVTEFISIVIVFLAFSCRSRTAPCTWARQRRE